MWCENPWFHYISGEKFVKERNSGFVGREKAGSYSVVRNKLRIGQVFLAKRTLNWYTISHKISMGYRTGKGKLNQ